MSLQRKLGLTGVALAALAALYTGAWFYLADSLEAGIDRWAAERRAEGWVAEYGSISMSGFPSTWRARLTEPRLLQQRREPAFLWTGPWLDLAWQPWRAEIVEYRSSGEHRLGYGPAAATEPAQIELGDSRGRLEFGEDGRLRLLSLRVDDAAITSPAGDELRLNRLKATLDTAPMRTAAAGADNRLKPSLRINGELFGLTLPEKPRPVLGRTIGLIALRGAILGDIPPANPREALDRWRRDGGTLEVEHLELGWSALTVRADGTLALDAALQPTGAMLARISGYSETVDALVAADLLRPGQALVTKFGLEALAHEPPSGGKPQIEVPLAAQDGFLFVGPIKLIPLPPVRWE